MVTECVPNWNVDQIGVEWTVAERLQSRAGHCVAA